MVNIGPRIGIEGEAEYRKQINNIIQSTKTLKSEYQALEAQTQKSLNPFKNFTNELNLNAEKHRLLSNAIDEQKAKLTDLRNMASMSSEKFGENATQTLKWKQAVADAEGELGRLENELKSIPNTLQSVGGAMQSVGSSVSSLGKDLSMKVTAPLVGVGALATKSFAEVDKTMQLTNATMNNTESEAKLLSKAMKEAASTSTFGMSDAAETTLNFARAGLDATQAANTLAPAMNLAAGEGGDLNTVSAGLVATINGFNDSFEDASSYADIFANACNNSALDVNSLSESMSVAAPIFNAAGYSVKDAALYMGIMANAGIDASTAANSLKTGMARLVSPAKEGKEWLDKLGVSITNADGSMKDSVAVQRELHDAFAGLSESQQIAAASAIFGKNQMSNWLALINTSTEDVNKLSSALDKEGTTMEMADAMMSGFGGSLEKLKSSADVAMVSLGEALAPSISKVADAIQGAVDWFNSLDESQQQLVAKIGVVAAAIGPVLVVAGTLISSIGSIVTALGTIGPALAAVKGGIAALTAGGIAPLVTAAAPFLVGGAIVAGVIAGGVMIYKHWDEIKAKVTELKDHISQKWEGIRADISSKWESVKSKTSETWNNLRNTVTSGANILKTTAQNRLDDIHNAFVNNGGGLRGTVAATWQVLTAQFRSGFDIMNSITGGALGNIANQFWNQFNSLKNSAWSWGADLINNLVAGIRDGIGRVGDAANAVANSIRSRLHFTEPDVGPLSDFHTYMPDMMKGLAQDMVDNIGVVEDAVTQVAGAIAQPLTTNNYGGISIIVNAAEGQSAEDIADVVEARISDRIERQEAVWA